MRKPKHKPNTDTSMVALTLHRDYPIFHANREHNESYTRIDGFPRNGEDYEILIVKGDRSLDGKDMSLFHYLLTALKHTADGKLEDKDTEVTISLSTLCKKRGLEPRQQNFKGIEDNLEVLMGTKIRIITTTNNKVTSIRGKAGTDFDELIRLAENIRHYVMVPIIKKVDVNGDIAKIEISKEYISSMKKKALFFESTEMQMLSSIGTIAYEKLQELVGGVENDNSVKKRRFREDDINTRVGWDKLSDSAIRKKWSLLNKEWQEKTSLPVWKRITINGVKWREPKERKFDLFIHE